MPFEFREATGSAHRSPGRRTGRTAIPSGGEKDCGGEGSIEPLVLYAKVANRYGVEAVCDRAQAAGLRPGMSLAEARARFPDFCFEEADPAADRKLLTAVADWCDRYTPLVAFDAADGLVLDITGCTHLFSSGERGLMADLVERLAGQGFTARAAIAGRARTASALARYAAGSCLAAGDEIEALASFPAAALRLPPETISLLSRLGLKRIGELLALPRAGLARRFGKATLEALDEALGRSERPIEPRLPVPLLIHERRLFEPVSRVEDILGLAAHLAQCMRADLERRGRGARRLELALFRVDGRVERIGLRTFAPLREPARIAKLFAEKLKGVGDELDAGFGYDLVRLSVLADNAMAPVQTDLVNHAVDCEPVEALLDRLAARLGEVAVFMLDPVESHRPERAQRLSGPRTNGLATPAGEAARPRPLRLFEPPEPIETIALVPEGAPERFCWRRVLYRVRRVEGPERIAPEWWQDRREATRDYWRVEDEDGRRYWLFRATAYEEDLPEEEDEGPEQAASPMPVMDGSLGVPAVPQNPSWYMHGIFA